MHRFNSLQFLQGTKNPQDSSDSRGIAGSGLASFLMEVHLTLKILCNHADARHHLTFRHKY